MYLVESFRFYEHKINEMQRRTMLAIELSLSLSFSLFSHFTLAHVFKRKRPLQITLNVRTFVRQQAGFGTNIYIFTCYRHVYSRYQIDAVDRAKLFAEGVNPVNYQGLKTMKIDCELKRNTRSCTRTYKKITI